MSVLATERSSSVPPRMRSDRPTRSVPGLARAFMGGPSEVASSGRKTPTSAPRIVAYRPAPLGDAEEAPNPAPRVVPSKRTHAPCPSNHADDLPALPVDRWYGLKVALIGFVAAIVAFTLGSLCPAVSQAISTRGEAGVVGR